MEVPLLCSRCYHRYLPQLCFPKEVFGFQTSMTEPFHLQAAPRLVCYHMKTYTRSRLQNYSCCLCSQNIQKAGTVLQHDRSRILADLLYSLQGLGRACKTLLKFHTIKNMHQKKITLREQFYGINQTKSQVRHCWQAACSEQFIFLRSVN